MDPPNTSNNPTDTHHHNRHTHTHTQLKRNKTHHYSCYHKDINRATDFVLSRVRAGRKREVASERDATALESNTFSQVRAFVLNVIQKNSEKKRNGQYRSFYVIPFFLCGISREKLKGRERK